MTRIVFLIQLVLVAMTMAQQPPTDAVFSWPFYASSASNADPVPFPTCLLWSQAVNRRDDYESVPGIGSYKLHRRSVLWHEARTTCVEEGGHLAIINSVAEANAITEIFIKSKPINGSQNQNCISIGFHDLFHEGEFVTIHDQTLERAGFARWMNRQPDSWKGNEDCGCLHDSGRLNDCSCETVIGFVCEQPIY